MIEAIKKLVCNILGHVHTKTGIMMNIGEEAKMATLCLFCKRVAHELSEQEILEKLKILEEKELEK